MPFLALLTGPLGKVAGIAALALALAGGAALALHEYGDLVIGRFQASQEKAAADAAAANAARVNAAVDQIAAAAAARLTASTQRKEAVSAAPDQAGFAYPARVRAALDSLRPGAGGSGGAAPAGP